MWLGYIVQEDIFQEENVILSLLEENVLGGFCTGGKLGRKICQEENDREDSVTQSILKVFETRYLSFISSKQILGPPHKLRVKNCVKIIFFMSLTHFWWDFFSDFWAYLGSCLFLFQLTLIFWFSEGTIKKCFDLSELFVFMVRKKCISKKVPKTA